VPADWHIELRIGINVGDIITDDNDIYGDGQCRRTSRSLGRARRDLCQPGGARPARLHVRGHGRAASQNHRPPAYRIPIAENAPPKAPLPLRDKPSIAMLPFQNMSGDPEQECFSDGISEDIIIALSKVRWFFVIARNMAPC
jgi:adenylate cyclase